MAQENNQKRRSLRLRGLRQRWVFNTIMPILVVRALVVTVAAFGITSYYYGAMQEGLETRVQAMANSFNEYFMSNGYNSYI